MLIYFFAAIGYACNYGQEFDSPGVVFIAISLGILTIAIVRHGLMNPMAIAAGIAHELRIPLAAIRMQARGVGRYLPTLLADYRLAAEHDLCADAIGARSMRHLSASGNTIGKEVDRTDLALDMLLAAAKNECFDRTTFAIIRSTS